MNTLSSPASLEAGRQPYMRRERFEVNQYVRVQVSESRFAIGVVTALDEARDTATVETRNGYEVTLPISALRRAFLVVLDLNGVLVARGRGSFILRPHVVDFLKFIFANFVVAVWTSGLQRSSDPIIEHVFGSYRDLLLFIFFREACAPKPTPENPYGTEKNLQVIFDRYPLSFHAVNTIIIDDSPDKCSHPDIALCPVPFKDPVAQSQDDGLLATMQTLREVLILDSGAPLIAAAEERRHRLAEVQEVSATSVDGAGGAPVSPKASTVAGAPSTVAATTTSATVASGADSRNSPPDMQEVELWKTRLCCDHLLSRCHRGADCQFSHDHDDGRPCSHKQYCGHHGSRWPKTDEEAQRDVQRQELRVAREQHYTREHERRRQDEDERLQKVRAESQRVADMKSRPPRQLNAQFPEQQYQQPRPPPPPPPQQQQRSGGEARRRGGSHGGWHGGGGGIEEDDWAAAPVGLSHTGDPAYDNMMNARQQQQQQQQWRGGGGGGGGGGREVVHDAAATNASSSAGASGGRRGRGPAQPSRGNVTAEDALFLLLQSANQHPGSSAPTNISTTGHASSITGGGQNGWIGESSIPSFSTRPMESPPPARGEAGGHGGRPMASYERRGETQQQRGSGGRGGSGGGQQQTSAQAIRITGAPGDQRAVVNQLQALLRQQQ